MLSWLEQHLLPCAYKSLLGIDCPICGFQRSLVALLKGSLAESFTLYPPLVPMLLLFILLAIYLINKKIIAQRFLVRYAYIVLTVVMVNYIVKLITEPILHTA